MDRVYVARQKGGRGLFSCEMCVKAEKNSMAWYVRNSNERLMAEIRKIKILDSEGAKEKYNSHYNNATPFLRPVNIIKPFMELNFGNLACE